MCPADRMCVKHSHHRMVPEQNRVCCGCCTAAYSRSAPETIKAFQDLLLGMAQVSEQQQFLVRASFLEIYNEEVRDLLSKNPKNKLDLKERKDQGVYVKSLNSFVVKSVAEITSVLEVSIHCSLSVSRCLSACLSVCWLYICTQQAKSGYCIAL